MIKVNLLSPDSIKKEERKEIFILAYAVLALFVLTGLVKYGFKLHFYQTIETRIANTTGELSQYESIVKQVEALQATKTVLETKKNVINSLMADRLIYPVFMEELSALLPSNVWLKGMSTQLAADKNMTVNLDAESLDNYGIADFITALSTNPDFSNVEMGAITTVSSQKLTTSAFKLSFTYLKKKS